MTTYLSLAMQAMLLGALTFGVVLIPLIVVQARRFGGLSLTRMAAFGMVAVYAFALLAYTMLPIPDGYGEAWCARYDVRVQPEPFVFVHDLAAAYAAGGAGGLASSFALRQLLLNVVLFVPLGVFGRRLLEWPAAVTILAGIGVSGLIELTQGTAAFGLLPCRWRIADADDLIANSVGAAIGVAIAPLVLSWVSRARALEGRRLDPRPVTRARRWLGAVVDAALFAVVFAAVELGARALDAIADTPGFLPETGVGVARWLLPALLVFVVPALSHLGASAGQRLLWLVPRWTDGAGTPMRRLALALLGPALPALAMAAAQLPGLGALGYAAPVWLLGLLVAGLLSRDGLAAALTGARYADSRTAPVLADRPEHHSESRDGAARPH